LTPLASCSCQATNGVPAELVIVTSRAILVASTLSDPPTDCHADPVHRLTRTWYTAPSYSTHATYGVPPTSAICPT
jgi:hypothetical protein